MNETEPANTEIQNRMRIEVDDALLDDLREQICKFVDHFSKFLIADLSIFYDYTVYRRAFDQLNFRLSNDSILTIFNHAFGVACTISR